MTTPQHTSTTPKTLLTPVKPTKNSPPPKASSSTSIITIPTQVIHQTDAPILWVSRGALAEVSKRIKENISETWEVKAVSNMPRPGSLLFQDATWIQLEIHSTDTLEGVIRRQRNLIILPQHSIFNYKT